MEKHEVPGWRGHLLELAWKLNDLGFDSVVRLPPGQRASLEVFVPPGRSKGGRDRRDGRSARVRTRRGLSWVRAVSGRIVKGVR
ncbi:hypothetical protein AB0M95_39090 [Sphaerisporangium sp. NPDC051017]|uniref:hypothetical protein n=1 Tax=Sphaerisporangium sp. NPDC051017 TaxID=3154636 RepID=UPI003447004F